MGFIKQKAIEKLQRFYLASTIFLLSNPVFAADDLQTKAQSKFSTFVKFFGAIVIFLVLLIALIFPIAIGIWWATKKYLSLQQQAERGGQDPGLKLYLEPGAIMLVSAVFNLVWYSIINQVIPLTNYINQLIQSLISMVTSTS